MEVFSDPGKEYRGTPFWSWNTKLDPYVVEGQVEQFKEMGMGGFYIHTRVGLDTEYMGKEYMECVKRAVFTAKDKGLYACLYDEDRWPSGYGGGRVTCRPEFRSRNILITPYKKGTKRYTDRTSDSMASASPQGNGRFLAAYYVRLGKNGELVSYERCREDSPVRTGEKIWYVYLEIAHDSPWFNNQSYVDSMNPEAVRYFLEVTHEKYKKEVGDEFGETIPSVFTDEPQFGRKHQLGTAISEEEIMLPFTDDLPQTYQEKYGEDLMEHIPEILWELPEGKISKYRYWYHDHVTERFASAFSDQVGEWCRKNGIRLAGHMMEEPTLQSQTQAIGEVMRSLRGFSLPGIDMLCDAREYTTAKQAESICHQYGTDGVVSELYGVTNWDFDFRRHKLQGDWQAALGITHRVHHLNWMSMGGEAKRDYPAAIGFQSPWYREYGVIETHFARVNTALRRGRPTVRIGVVHPVESCWILFGPNEQTGQRRQELDERFCNVTEWLLFNNLDFDYLSESLLPDQWDGKKVGEMDYDAVVIPGCLTLRSTTLKILEEMKKLGKKIIFMGKAPAYIDAAEDRRGEELAQRCVSIEFSKYDLLEKLEEFRTVEIRFYGDKHLKKPNHKKNWNGERTEKHLCQIREEGDSRWVFIANGRPQDNPDLALPDDIGIEFRGSWDVTVLNTMDGTAERAEVCRRCGKTYMYRRLYEHDSLLLYLKPADREKENRAGGVSAVTDDGWVRRNLFTAPVQITREEPNVLVLDMPMYRFGTERSNDLNEVQAEGPEEILRVDNLLREKLGLPLRRAALAQPWTEKEPEDTCPIELIYTIACEDEIKGASLGLESIEAAEIWLDGNTVSVEKGEEFYVDPCIKVIRLPDLTEGSHELRIRYAFHRKVNLEACYILGEFDVRVSGSRTVLFRKEDRNVRNFWGSLTEQGMPFYGGNADYRTQVDLEAGEYMIEVSKYRAPLLEVRIDGEKKGNIIGAPYRVPFTIKQSGKHNIEIRSFGSRVNTFGAFHDCDEKEIYFDPNAWRTEGEDWSYEYQLKETGLLKSPVLWERRRKDESDQSAETI